MTASLNSFSKKLLWKRLKRKDLIHQNTPLLYEFLIRGVNHIYFFTLLFVLSPGFQGLNQHSEKKIRFSDSFFSTQKMLGLISFYPTWLSFKTLFLSQKTSF